MNTTVMVALDDDVVAYLDDVLKDRTEQNPSRYINEVLRREMHEHGMPTGQKHTTRYDGHTPLEIPGEEF